VIVSSPVDATGRFIGAGIFPHARKILKSHTQDRHSPAKKPLERAGMNPDGDVHRRWAGRSAPSR
jgi:hypothetical protein